MVKCIICGQKYEKGVELSFHAFPRNGSAKNVWLEITKLPKVTISTKICSLHFSADSFLPIRNFGLRLLKPDAAPSAELCVKGVKPIQKNDVPYHTATLRDTRLEEQRMMPRQALVLSTEPEALRDIKTEPASNFNGIHLTSNIGESDKPLIDERFANRNIEYERNLGYSQPVKKRRIWRPVNNRDISDTRYSCPTKSRCQVSLVMKKLTTQNTKIQNLQRQQRRFVKKIGMLETRLAVIENERKNSVIPIDYHETREKTHAMEK